MKYFYHVPNSDIRVLTEDEAPIKDLSEKDVLSTLEYTPSTADKDDTYLLFPTLEEAVKFARVGQEEEEHKYDAFPIYLVAVDEKLKVSKPFLVDYSAKEIKKSKKNHDVVAYEVVEAFAKDCKLVSASLKHISQDFDDRILNQEAYEEFLASQPKAKKPAKVESTIENPVENVEPQNADVNPEGPAEAPQADKPADEPSKFNLNNLFNLLKRMAPASISVGVVAGLYNTGAIANGLSLIGNAAGYAIPAVGAAGIATELAAIALTGLAVYGALLAGQTIITALGNAAKTAIDNYRKTTKTKHAETYAANVEAVNSLEAELAYGPEHAITQTFAALLNQAPEEEFDEAENLVVKPVDENNPAPLNRYQVIEREKQLLADLKAANDAKRKELEENVLSPNFKFK